MNRTLLTLVAAGLVAATAFAQDEAPTSDQTSGPAAAAQTREAQAAEPVALTEAAAPQENAPVAPQQPSPVTAQEAPRETQQETKPSTAQETSAAPAPEAAPASDVQTAEPAPAPEPAPAITTQETRPETTPETIKSAQQEPSPETPSAAAQETPRQAAVRDAVRRMLEAPVARASAGQTPAAALRREREAIAAFYEARAFAPLWLDGDGFGAAARAAISRLERARDDGLDLSQYTLPTPTAGAGHAALASAELALSQAVVGYARQASGGRLDPRAIGRLITAKPETAEAADALARVAGASDAGQALEGFNPPHPGYRALREKLAEARRERPAVARQKIQPGPVLKVGMTDPRVPLIRARFGIDAAQDGAKTDLVYDTRVASAVADFQRANGLPATGALTARTIAALSGGDPAGLEAELLANMERWRWAPRDLGGTRIEVNIPAFEVRYVRDGEIVHRARAIVGKPETQTPIFSDTMEFLVVNPSWHVPQSIIRKQLAQDPNYYARNGYEVVRRGGNVFVRQPPGERNALGHVKFMFPNDHAVYLHDTPNRNLFNAARRAYSHGCVRVDQPFKLADVLLAPQQDWNEQKLRSLVGKGERTVRLATGVPVHLLYFTAFVDEEGKLQLRDDLYGHSRRVQTALGL